MKRIKIIRHTKSNDVNIVRRKFEEIIEGIRSDYDVNGLGDYTINMITSSLIENELC